VPLRLRLASAERLSERAICCGLEDLNTDGWRSSASLWRVTCADQRLDLLRVFLARCTDLRAPLLTVVSAAVFVPTARSAQQQRERYDSNRSGGRLRAAAMAGRGPRRSATISAKRAAGCGSQQ
jgi:hypothetical protein